MVFQMGSGVSSGTGSGCSEENGGYDSHNVRKNYHRHTPEQIQRLDSFYKECPHPDENQRRQLGLELGLEPRQIKFWFQNKRTQIKAQNERSDNNVLRTENDRIRCENMAIREALKNVICPSCGGPPIGEEERKQSLQKLQQENAELKSECERVSKILAKYLGKPLPGAIFSLPDICLTGQGSRSPAVEVDSLIENIIAENLDLAYQMKLDPETEKSHMTEIAESAMDELIKLFTAEQPLWIKSPLDGQYILDRDSYEKTFSRPMDRRYLKSRMESSKDSGVVVMNSRLLLDLYLDPDKWVDLFPTVFPKARTINVLEPGLSESRSGSLQLIYEQMHILSPLVRPREFYVLRYCQQIKTGIWVIVDISYHCLRDGSHVIPTRCWKHPSGCMIQELPNGLTKVTCIENVEVDDSFHIHPVYEILLKSALGFGAKRWISTLQRTCERYSYLVDACRPSHELEGGRKGMIMLAFRMLKNYCSIFSSFDTSDFHQASEMTNNRVRIAVRKNVYPGQPVGLVISAASSFWLPALPQSVFAYLSNYVMRSQWDVLCHGNPVCEVLQIPTGTHSANCISVLRPLNSIENLMIFQESMVDELGSFLVYAPIDSSSMSELVSGSDSSTVPILASGFAITTDGTDEKTTPSSSATNPRSSGSLLTVAFQILACTSLSTEDMSMDVVSSVDGFVSRVVRVIKSAFDCSV